MTTEPTTDRGALRDLAADAIRAAACPGNDCPLSEADCSEQRIQPAAWERGVLSEVYGRPEWFADAVLAVLPEPADQAAALNRAADEVFALDYDALVGEEGDENLGSMREAWDLGTIHAEKLLRRLADEAQQPECNCGGPATSTTLPSGTTYEEHKRTCAVMAAEAPHTATQGDGAGEPAELRDLPREVRHLVHAVDRMRSDWAESSPERQTELWRQVHEASDAVWNRTLAATTPTTTKPETRRCPACGHVSCDGDGPCGAILSVDVLSKNRCACTGPAAGVRQDRAQP